MEDVDPGPGLHHLRAADPAAEATALAGQLRATLCTTKAEADAELAERRQRPAPAPDVLASLELLAARLERAARIGARTRARAESEVAERLASASAGVAVHPTTIRDRAAAVEAARRALADAEQAIVAEGAGAPADPELDAAGGHERAAAEPAHSAGPSPRAEGPSPATRRNRALGAVLAAAGIGLLLIGLRVTTLWAALLPLLVACLWAVRYLGPRTSDDRRDRAEASHLLAEVGASTDQLFGARRAAQDEREGRPSAPAVRRDRALEDLRVAERAWHELAGDDVDTSAVDDVVRRYDPQHEDARLLAAEAVAVRAVDVMLHNLEQQWIATWTDLGGAVPEVSSAPDAVRTLRERAARPVVLVGDATALAEELRQAAPASAVVVVEAEGPAGQPAIS